MKKAESGEQKAGISKRPSSVLRKLRTHRPSSRIHTSPDIPHHASRITHHASRITHFIRGSLDLRQGHFVEGLSPEAAGYARRNFRFGVANGVLFGLVDALMAPSLVLALFVNRLGGSNLLVGLLPAIMAGGWFLPQMLVASRVQGLPLVMHWYRRTAVVRGIALVLLTASTFVLAGNPTAMLAAFFVLYSVYAFGAGVSGIPWFEMVGKVISPRRRGVFFSIRSFWGGALALLAAGLIGAALSEQVFDLRFPYNFTLLFGVSTAVAIGALWSWASIREPAAVTTAPPQTLRSIFERGMAALRGDRDYRSFMMSRLLLALVAVADPFYVVYAKTELNAPIALVGLYLGASAASSLLSNFLWGPLADRAGNRTLMMLTVVSSALVPLTALVLPLLVGVIPSDFVSTAFALVFVLGGLAAASGRILNNTMMLRIAPAAERATYIGFLSTVLGLVTFIPVFGGALVDVLGYVPLFALSLALALLALAAGSRMSMKT